MRGHVRKRGNSWVAVVYVGRDEKTGKDRYKWSTHRTKREAEANLSNMLGQLHSGGFLPSTKLRVGEFLAQWLRTYAAGAVAPTTLRTHQEAIDCHLTPALGSIPLIRLTPQRIQEFYSSKLDDLSTTSVHKIHRLLREALGHAVKWQLLARNPALLTDPPRPRRLEMQVLDEEQIRLLLAEAKRSSRFYRLYLTAILTGARMGELLALRWRDMDFTFEAMRIAQTFYRLSGRKRTGEPPRELWKEPKSAKSKRTIALPPILLNQLQALRDEITARARLLHDGFCPKGSACGDPTCHAHFCKTGRDCRKMDCPTWHDLDLVFCQPNGKPLHAHHVTQRDLRSVLKRAGLPRITFHALRHSHATLLLKQGVNVRVVQERLGHYNPSFTLAVYSHVLPGMQEEAARKLEDRLIGTGDRGAMLKNPS